MINKYVAMGLGALIALAPVAASAQTTDTTAAPAGSMAAPTTGHMGSHRGHMRRKGNTAAHRARASAHHMNKKMMAPAEAPKS